MACMPLKKVCPDHSCWRVRVRVVRFHEEFNDKQPPQLSKFEFIMLDEEGTAMDAAVPFQWINKYMSLLIEGRVYTIHYFQVANAKSTYRPVDHPYMARFTNHTQITEFTMVPQNFPLYACSIASFATLHKRVGDRVQMSDTVGIFTKCSRPSSRSTQNGNKTLMNVEITDGRETAVLTLWGPQAERFNGQALIDMARQAPVVLLFVGVTVNIYNVASHCNAQSHAFGMLILLYQKLYCCSKALDLLPHSHTGSGKSTVLLRRMLLLLSYQISIHMKNWGKKFIVVAVLKELVLNQPWHYMACTTCKTKTRPNGSAYRCNNYSCSTTTAEERYRLTFLAADPDTAEDGQQKPIELICFGPLGNQFTGMPVENLIDPLAQEDHVPEQITRLIGAKYEFRLRVTKGSLQTEINSFKIDAFTRIIEPENQQDTVLPACICLEAGTSSATLDNTVETVVSSEQISITTATENGPTPVKDVLDAAGLEMTTTNLQTKDKRCVDSTDEENKILEDSDCEESVPPRKKPRTARKLSMTATQDDEQILGSNRAHRFVNNLS